MSDDFLIQNKKVREILQKHLTPKEEEKKTYGEVFTPLELVYDMLDKIPPAVWRDKNHKWLDPAAGIGNFLVVVYYKLMDTLSSEIKTDRVRSKHIIENMLYMNELNPSNVALCRRIFKMIDPSAKPNIRRGDFLQNNFKIDDVERYDVIVGNPPFNGSQTVEEGGKRGGGDSLWPQFVIKSIDLLVDKHGILCFVHPSSWRKPPEEDSKTAGLFERMAHENQLIYLEIHSKPDGQKLFGVKTRYDWYVLQKTPSKHATQVKDQLGNQTSIQMRDWQFLPNCHFGLIRSLLSRKEEDYVIYSRNQYGTDKSWTTTRKTPNPLIHSIPLSGIRYHYTTTRTPPVKQLVPMFGVKKVIIGETDEIHDVVVDTKGEYGMTQGAMGLRIQNAREGQQYKDALMSEKFKNVIQAMSFSNFRIDWRMFKYFKRDFYRSFREKKTAKNRVSQNKTRKNLRT